MKVKDQKVYPRFHPMRILIICLISGLSLAGFGLIAGGLYGFLKGTVLPLVVLAKLIGLGFVAGCVLGLAKL